MWTIWRQPSFSEWRWMSLGCLSEGPGRQMEKQKKETCIMLGLTLKCPLYEQKCSAPPKNKNISLVSVAFWLQGTANCQKPNEDFWFYKCKMRMFNVQLYLIFKHMQSCDMEEYGICFQTQMPL